MRDTLILPTEFPPTLRDIKRALLCFDKVNLVDPADRELIPPNASMSALIGLPIVGMNTGAVRPLGKIAHYDKDFEKLMDAIAPAAKEGLIKVVSSYDRTSTERFTIGAVPTGGYPLNPRFVLMAYRSIASDQALLASVLDDLAVKTMAAPDNWSSLSISGWGDGGINRSPRLPAIQMDETSNEEIEIRTNVARGRLASIVKFTGYCEAKELIPTYPAEGLARTMSALLRNTRDVLASSSSDDFWLRRNRVLELAFHTLVDPVLLDSLSITDVLNLRSNE